MIPIRKDWQEPYFDGHYVPLIMVLVIAVPFLAMLLVATERWAEAEHERDVAISQLEEVLEETKNIQKRIDMLRKEFTERERKFYQQYTDMTQHPPVWPSEVLVAGEPSVKIPTWGRR